jgi:intracellular sulfur oxidation DsrE/DsrF family protein
MLLIGLSAALPPLLAAQPLTDRVEGPIIEDFGATYPVEALDFDTPTDQAYRLLFDVSTSPDAPDALNSKLNTVARFLNMHARAGVPRAQMEAAVVLHGTAGKYALRHAEYEARYGVENTNLMLLEALHEAGVAIYLCGQTAMHRGLPPGRLAPEVSMALSAMTVIAALHAQGYTVVAW